MKAPNLTYELIDVFAGVQSVAVHWRRPGREVIELMKFNTACKVVNGSVLLKIRRQTSVKKCTRVSP